MRHLIVVLLCSTLLIAAGSQEELFRSADQKIEQIANDQAPRGSTINISKDELNALVRGKLSEEGVEGVREPKIDLGNGTGSWSGIVNFEKVPQLESLRNNFLLSSILKGEKPISAGMKLDSANGKATVTVEYVTIGETRFDGGTLGFLVERLILKDFPDAKLGEPFDLEHNVEQIKLLPTGVQIKIAD